MARATNSERQRAYRKFRRWGEDKVRLRADTGELCLAEKRYADAWLRRLDELHEPWDRLTNDQLARLAGAEGRRQDRRTKFWSDLLGKLFGKIVRPL